MSASWHAGGAAAGKEQHTFQEFHLKVLLKEERRENNMVCLKVRRHQEERASSGSSVGEVARCRYEDKRHKRDTREESRHHAPTLAPPRQRQSVISSIHQSHR